MLLKQISSLQRGLDGNVWQGFGERDGGGGGGREREIEIWREIGRERESERERNSVYI